MASVDESSKPTTTTFAVPFVVSNPDNSWGPCDPTNAASSEYLTGNLSKYAALPYAPFGRNDRLGRVADFTGSHRNYYGGDRDRGGGDRGRRFRRNFQDDDNDGENVRNGDINSSAQEEAFRLVDTTKTTSATSKRFVNQASKRRQHTNRLRQVNARRQQSSGGAATAMDKMTRNSNSRGGGGRGGPQGGGRGGGRGYGGYHHYQQRVDRQPSVVVQSTWKEVEDLDLGKLTKTLTASTVVATPEDVLWCGFLDPYNEIYDKISASKPVPLKRMDRKEFYPVTTTDDPVMEKLAIDGIGQVFITDTILAHLMTCTRSVYPWDIVIQKLPGGTLFFDKRDNSQFDYLTVQETANNPPTDDEGINKPERLGLEATMINQNFSQQILKKAGRVEMDLPNPFFDEDDADGMEPASVAFRYRKFRLDEKTDVICRTELHGIVKKSQYMTAFALNEYMPSATSGSDNAAAQALGMSWRDKIDTQRGAVLATELKNNSFKLAKWTAQSLLAGAEQMKIGFVSRASPKNAYEHVILATQFYRPKDFATQITLSEGQMWATFRMFVQLLQKKEDGKYVLMRDPNKAMLRLYKVPPETFEEDE